MVAELQLDLPLTEIARFCHKWKISEFAVFGSILREDFRPESDIDVLVSFEPHHAWSLFDHMHMEEELSLILARPVDIVNKKAITNDANTARRDLILGNARVLYAA